MKYFVFVLCYFALLDEIAGIGSMGPMGNLIVNSIYECEDSEKPQGDEIKLEAKLVKLNDDGEKAVDILFENKIDINDDLQYMIDIKKFENGNWQKFYNVKGSPCTDLDRFIKKLWRKVIGSLEPKLDSEKPCPIPAGSYKSNKFQALAEDIEAKAIFYGKLLLKITVKDKDGKMLMCIMGEGDSQAPS